MMVLSCDKYRARRWSGTYRCSVHLSSWNMTGVTIDTAYTEEVELTANKKNVVIFGNEVPVDSLRDEHMYKVGDVHNYFVLQLKGDSIYYFHSSGGLGGNGSYEYRGIKK